MRRSHAHHGVWLHHSCWLHHCAHGRLRHCTHGWLHHSSQLLYCTNGRHSQRLLLHHIGCHHTFRLLYQLIHTSAHYIHTRVVLLRIRICSNVTTFFIDHACAHHVVTIRYLVTTHVCQLISICALRGVIRRIHMHELRCCVEVVHSAHLNIRRRSGILLRSLFFVIVDHWVNLAL